LEHDPEKWIPVFLEDHAQSRINRQDNEMEPWRRSIGGMSVSLRVTPRGGRDAIDGIERLSDGGTVMKVRVRAIADDGEANRAVMKLLAKALHVPQASMRIASGAASRLKQVEISGDPQALQEKLSAACEATDKRKDRAT
jgi:uncharacterized protein (TIGR00251 family)